MGAAVSILVIIVGVAVAAAIDGDVIGVDATWIGIAAIIAGALGLLAWLIVETRREGERSAIRASESDVHAYSDEPHETARDTRGGPLT